MSKRKKSNYFSPAKPKSAKSPQVVKRIIKVSPTAKVEIVAPAEAKVVAPVKPKQIVKRIIRTVAPVKSEAVAPVKSEAAAPAKSEVVASVKSETVAPAKSEAVASVKSEAVAPVKSEAVAPVKSETVAPAKSEAVASVKSEAVAPVKSEAVAPVKSEAVAPVKAAAAASVKPKQIVKRIIRTAAPVKSEAVAPAKSAAVAPNACPDVSVVIPMYNAEEYIGECLNSILAQTFQNYEVIVVDDCSTDNSPDIVKSFIPKFGGRLTHFRLRQNTGGAGIPRNTGITLARGEYIRFMDSDDRVVPNALEEDFTLAKEYDADVVYHTLFYDLSADGTESKLSYVPKYRPGDKVELDKDYLTRVKELATNKYYHAPWRSFSRREFLVANELYFPNIRPYEDIVWNYALLIYAKRFLRVPTALYFYRDNENSMLRTEKTSAQNAKFYLNPIILGLKSLDTFISRNEFFIDKPQLHYALLDNYFNGRFTSLFKDNSIELQPFALYETLKNEFGEKLGEYDILIPALCTALVQQQKITAAKLKQFKEYCVQSNKRIAELENKINQIKIKR